MKQIKLINPARPKWKDVEKPFKEIVMNGALSTNKWTKKVEKKICQIHKCKYALLTSSATSAFMLALHAVNKIYAPNKIRMMDFTWNSMKDIALMMYSRCDLQFIDLCQDVDKDCFFIPNMIFGSVQTFDDHPLVLYDSAHCFGNKKCNGRGLGEIISFSPAKIVTACEGGAFITNNKELYEEALKKRRYHGRISELNACFLYYNIKNLKRRQREKLDALATCLNLFPYDIKPMFAMNKGDVPNEIAFLSNDFDNEFRNKVSKFMEIRQRYEPYNNNNIELQWAYSHILMLPALSKEKMRELVKKIISCIPIYKKVKEGAK